jgi:hypothetical protein
VTSSRNGSPLEQGVLAEGAPAAIDFSPTLHILPAAASV